MVRGPSGKILNQRFDRDGYLRVHINGHQHRSVHVHLIMARVFLGPAKGRQVRHLDSNKTNNHVCNLKYGTPKDNARDRISDGKHGPKRKKFNKYRVRRSDGVVFKTTSEAARAVRCSPSLIWRVLHGKRKTSGGYTYEWEGGSDSNET